MHGVPIRAFLGSSETGGIASRDPVHENGWRPMPGVEVCVAAEGRMSVLSPWLSSDGPRPWPTDDRIQLREDGSFLHVGRLDDVVKIGGKRISVELVRTRLLAMPGVRDAAVLAEPSAGGRGMRLAAVVESEALTPEAIRRALREDLDEVAVPRRLRVVTRLPREASGKIRRNALLELLGQPPLRVLSETPAEAGSQLPLAALEVVLPRGYSRFAGHFPGAPILPGVSILHDLVVAPQRARDPRLGPAMALRNVKLRRPLRPDERVRIAYRPRADGWVQFSVDVGSDPCASGLVRFGGDA
jgi:hypothetical protein